MNTAHSSLSFCFGCRKWAPSRSGPSQSSPHPVMDQSKSDRQALPEAAGTQGTSLHLCPLPVERHQRHWRIYGMEIHKYYKAGLFSKELVVKHLSQQHWDTRAGRTRSYPPPGVGLAGPITVFPSTQPAPPPATGINSQGMCSVPPAVCSQIPRPSQPARFQCKE